MVAEVAELLSWMSTNYMLLRRRYLRFLNGFWIIVYRSPYYVNHSVTTITFFTEFTVIISSPARATYIKWAFTDNWWQSISTSMYLTTLTEKFLELLESIGRVQHVKEPTHEFRHILDLIITRRSDDIISETPSIDRLISDHAAVKYAGWNQPRPTWC